MTGPSISVLHSRALVITHENLMLMGGFPLLGDSGTCPLSISWFCFPLGLQSPLQTGKRTWRGYRWCTHHVTDWPPDPVWGQGGQEYVVPDWVASSKRHNTVEEKSGFWWTVGHIQPLALPSCVILGKFMACPGLSSFLANAVPVRLL